MLKRLCLLLALAGSVCGVAACRSAARPAEPRDGLREIPAAVVEARRRLRAHDTAGALRALDPSRPLTPGEPERSWILARIWVERAQAAWAREQAGRLVSDGYGLALQAGVAETPEKGLERLRPALDRGGGPWLHLAAGYLHQFRGDGGPARVAAAAARGSGIVFVEVEARLVAARACLLDGLFEAAAGEARAAMLLDPTDTRAHGLVAEALRRAGDVRGAADALNEAMRQVPESERYPRALADLLRLDEHAELPGRVASALRTLPPPTTPEREALHGWLAEHRRAHDEAIAHYERALAGGADPIPVERDLRRLLTRRGAYARGVALLLRAVPASVRRDPRNLRRPAWDALEEAVRRAPCPAAPEPARVALASALVGVGALPEARAVLEGLTAPAARALDARLGRHLAFVESFEHYVEGGYRRGDRKEGDGDFRTVVVALGGLARKHLSPEEAASFDQPLQGARDVSLVGAWLDHATDTTSPVVAYFRRYGLFLMLGQRSGQPTEAILLSLASLTRGQEIRTRGCCHRQDVAIGFDRRLRPFAAVQGADLGGACLPDGIWMDLDGVRTVEHGVRRAVTRDPGLVALASGAPRLVPPDTIDGVFAVGDAGGAGERLVLRYLARCPADPWGSLRTLIAHEYGHLVEIRRHLPLFERLPATIGLLFESKLSLTVLEYEVERRAQLAAVAESADPDLALAEMLLVFPVVAREPEAHDGGYLMAVRQLVRHVWSRPDLYPQVDRRFRVLPQLDRLTNDQLRQAARSILPR